jgi:hypothetical protein
MWGHAADCKVRTVSCLQSVKNEHGEDLRSLQLNTLCLLNFNFLAKFYF